MAIDLERRSDLRDAAAVHDADARAHGHRLDLVVGDVDHRRAEAPVQRRDLAARRHAQCRVEVGERLVEQEHLGVAHDGAAERHALALTARQRMRLAAEQLREAQDARDVGNAPLDLGTIHGAAPEAERQVVLHRHVRVERIGLEHHRDVAVLGGHLVDHAPVDRERARRDRLEAGDHAQRRRLAAARGPEQHHELAVRDFERHIVGGRRMPAVVDLGELVDLDDGHQRFLIISRRPPSCPGSASPRRTHRRRPPG